MANPQITYMQQRAAYLIERYITGNINNAELSELHQLTESSAAEVQLGIQQWLESREADPAYDPCSNGSRYWAPSPQLTGRKKGF